MAQADPRVLFAVSVALGTLIQAKVYESHPGDTVVEYGSPSSMQAATQGSRPVILLYLYRITDNPYLRNAPPSIEWTPDGFKRRPAPAAVDISFMMVAYSKTPTHELLLTDALKRLFAEVSELPNPFLAQAPVLPGNQRISILSENLTMDEIQKLWSSFPNQPYRLALFYTLTPVLLPLPLPEDGVARVSALIPRKPSPSSPPPPDIGWRRVAVVVVDVSTKAILPSATIRFLDDTVAQCVKSTKTPEGFYLFSGLPELEGEVSADHDVCVQAAGYNDLTTKLKVWKDPTKAQGPYTVFELEAITPMS